jgi:hypothetical protein
MTTTYFDGTLPIAHCPFPECAFNTGDVDAQLALELLKIHGLAHAIVGATPHHATAKAEKVTEGTYEDWNYFLTRWADYEEATGITGKNLILQLLECCDEILRRDLTHTAGGSLTIKSKKDVLALIKTLAIREENPMVARAELQTMRQDHDEPVRPFSARVRGQADTCQYAVLCPDWGKDVDYTEPMIRDVVSHGLADKDIQLDLLGDKKQSPSLEEVLKFVEQKESGKRSVSRLANPHYTAATSSSYKKQQRGSPRNHERTQQALAEQPPDPSDTCTYCGKQGHGAKASARVRRKDCPAYGQTCGKCNIRNHLSSVCRGGRRTDKANDNTTAALQEDIEHGHLFGIRDSTNNPPQADSGYSTCVAIILDHHVHDQLSNVWLKRSSMPQPHITLSTNLIMKTTNPSASP